MEERDIYIVGAGGFGREVYQYLLDLHTTQTIGFLDDNPAALQQSSLAHLSCVPIRGWQVRRTHRYVLAVGDPKLRRVLQQKLGDATFFSVIHPQAYVAAGALIRNGCVLAPFAFVGNGAQVGEHTVINTYASVSHDARVGPYTVLSPYATLNGNAVCEQEVFLGTHSTVTPGRTVGARTRLGAGAVVLRDLPADVLAFGCPAVVRQAG